MSKHNDAEKNLAELKALNDALAASTITDKQIRRWAERLENIVTGCRDFGKRWMRSLPARGSPELADLEMDWARMANEMQKVYTEAYVAARTPADFLKLDLSLFGEPLDRAGAALLQLFQLPLALRTQRTVPERQRPEPYDLAPSVRQAIIDAASKPEKKPIEGEQ